MCGLVFSIQSPTSWILRSTGLRIHWAFFSIHLDALPAFVPWWFGKKMKENSNLKEFNHPVLLCSVSDFICCLHFIHKQRYKIETHLSRASLPRASKRSKHLGPDLWELVGDWTASLTSWFCFVMWVLILYLILLIQCWPWVLIAQYSVKVLIVLVIPQFVVRLEEKALLQQVL